MLSIYFKIIWEWEYYRKNDCELIIAETGWKEHGDSLYSSLLLCRWLYFSIIRSFKMSPLDLLVACKTSPQCLASGLGSELEVEQKKGGASYHGVKGQRSREVILVWKVFPRKTAGRFQASLPLLMPFPHSRMPHSSILCQPKVSSFCRLKFFPVFFTYQPY